jgi:hypothetical protein
LNERANLLNKDSEGAGEYRNGCCNVTVSNEARPLTRKSSALVLFEFAFRGVYDRLALQDQAFGSSRVRDLAQRTSLQGSLRGRELVNSVVNQDIVTSMKTLWEGFRGFRSRGLLEFRGCKISTYGPRSISSELDGMQGRLQDQ